MFFYFDFIFQVIYYNYWVFFNFVECCGFGILYFKYWFVGYNFIWFVVFWVVGKFVYVYQVGVVIDGVVDGFFVFGEVVEVELFVCGYVDVFVYVGVCGC